MSFTGTYRKGTTEDITPVVVFLDQVKLHYLADYGVSIHHSNRWLVADRYTIRYGTPGDIRDDLEQIQTNWYKLTEKPKMKNLGVAFWSFIWRHVIRMILQPWSITI